MITIAVRIIINIIIRLDFIKFINCPFKRLHQRHISHVLEYYRALHYGISKWSRSEALVLCRQPLL